VLKATGVAATIQPSLSEEETQALKKSAEILRKATDGLNY
jgi:malate/lactate dehydrogenase